MTEFPRTRWTRDQLLLALRLYMRLPFGRLHRRNPEIIAIAAKIGRTPDALAMKACNFASLDPKQRERNIKGLSGASEADRHIWAEFIDNPEALAAEAEEAFAQALPAKAAREEAAITPPFGETEVARLVRPRRVQSFFRAAVLTTYARRCAITGIALPELLVASHIIPWVVSIKHRADPTNGLCLNALLDRAFDRGLITLDESFRVVVSRRLREGIVDAALDCSLTTIEGRKLMLPDRFPPDVTAIAYHRENVFTSD